MKTPFIWLAAFLFLTCSVKLKDSNAQPVSHQMWDNLLQKYVTEEGWVDYKGFQKDSLELNEYLELLSNHHPNKSWTDDERLAYWINAYNAFTIDLVSRHYPVSSIKDIKNGIPFVNTVWDIKFITIEGEKYDLNNIEHGIIRKYFEEPRIHFAINCASRSCPKLLNKAYTTEQLDDQLEEAAKTFINDSFRNDISTSSAKLSKLFTWFKGDFENGDQKLIDFINQYSDQRITSSTEISYKDYDWAINDLGNVKKTGS